MHLHFAEYVYKYYMNSIHVHLAQAVLYSVKIKCEFVILNHLGDMLLKGTFFFMV